MSDYVLLDKLRKYDKLQGLPSILSCVCFASYTRTRKLESICHTHDITITLKFHFWCEKC